MRNSKVKIEGLSSAGKFGRFKSVTAYVKAINLVNYFSVFDVPAELEGALQAIHNRKNQKRINEIKQSIFQGIESTATVPNLSVTFVLSGTTVVKPKGGSLLELEYDPLDSLAVNGVLVLFTIIQMLGFSHPFEKKRASKGLVQQNSSQRQQLSTQPIQVTLLYDDEQEVSQEECIDLYKSFSQRNINIYAPLNESLNAAKPINSYVNDIVEEIDLNLFGGMNHLSIRNSIYEAYATNEATMIRLVLGALGGAGIQDKNKTHSFGGKTGPLSANAAANSKSKICAFLKSWLAAVQPQMTKSSKGFSHSTQLWQALGLVMHNLIVKEEASLKDCSEAGRRLGKLDYSKSATHWGNCDAMEIDASGVNYKNATGGGRAFRIGLANYLITKY